MLASLTELRSYYAQGKDGEIGRIDDVCFREEEGIVRYVVVSRDLIVHSPVIASEEPITPDSVRRLREYYDQDAR